MTAMTAAPATTEAHAAPSAPGPETSHATVLLLRQTHPSSAAAEALVRLRGELMAAGFTVQVADVSTSSDLRAAIDRAAARARADAVIAIFGDPTRQGAELRILDRATGKVIARRIPVPAESTRAAEILSIRALELLQASLLEVALASPPGDPSARGAPAEGGRPSGSPSTPKENAKRPETARAAESARPRDAGRPVDPHRPPATERRPETARSEVTGRATETPRPEATAAGPTNDESPVEPRDRASRDQPPPAPPSPAADRGPVVATRHASDAVAPARPALPFRYALELGGVVLGSFEGLPPSVLPVIRGGVRLSRHFEARLAVAGLGTRARVQTADGTAGATVALSFGLVEAVLGFRPGARVQPFVSLGAGAARLSVEGRAGWPYPSRADALWTAIADAGLGVRVGLGQRFQLAAELHAQGAYPYPVVRFLDTTLAEAGRPTVLGGLSLVTWL